MVGTNYSDGSNKRWFLGIMKVPTQSKGDLEYITKMFETVVEHFFDDIRINTITGLSLSKRTLATLALYHRLLVAVHKQKHAPFTLAPICRLLANAAGKRGKQYLPENVCGDDVYLAANQMPAYWTRMTISEHGAAQPEDLTLSVATPPVMCWICGEGFMNNAGLFQHCCNKHGDCAEYRKRLFWRTQQDGFKPLLPWVKRHILMSATFHLTYSIPGISAMKWSHPEPFIAAKPRSEIACVVCARKDWLESRFAV